MDWEFLRKLIEGYRGRLAGALMGLLFGILTVTWGLGKAFFIMICIALGYAIGRRMDSGKSIRNFIERLFGEW